MPTVPGRDALRLTPTEVAMRPGDQPAQIVAHIFNVGDTVERYFLEVERLDPSWYSLERSSVSLLPGDDISVIIRLHPSHSRNIVAGRYDFNVNLLLDNRDILETVAGVIEIQGEAKVSYTLSPQRVTGRKGNYRLTLTNTGTQEAELTLSGQDPETALSFNFDEEAPRVPPYGNVTIPVTVKPRRARFVGPQQMHLFTIAVDSVRPLAEAPPPGMNVVRGELMYTKYLRSWRLPIMALLLVALIVVAFIFGPRLLAGILNGPSITVFTTVPTSINKGESVTLRWEVKNAAKAEIAEDGREVTFDAEGKGSLQDAPNNTRTYTLCITSTDGSKKCSPPSAVSVIDPSIFGGGSGAAETATAIAVAASNGVGGAAKTGTAIAVAAGNGSDGKPGDGKPGDGKPGGKATPTPTRRAPTATRPSVAGATATRALAATQPPVRSTIAPTQVVVVQQPTATPPVVVVPPTVATGCTPAADTNGRAEPRQGKLNDNIRLIATGFRPGEPILFSLLTPDGRVLGGDAPIEGAILPDGTLDVDPITITQDLVKFPGQWTVTIVGAASNNRSVIHFCVSP